MNQRLAVLSDIHGNIRALNAVLADIKRRSIRAMVNLGDCAYGPFDPRPVMNRLLALALPTVSGNEDRILVEAAGGAPHSRTATFCAQRLESAHIDWLARLPLTLELHGALLFHGTPDDDTQYLLTTVHASGVYSRDPRDIEALLRGWPQSLILCGHDHTPRIMKHKRGKMIVNPGSVGCPAYMDDIPCPHAIENRSRDARYVVIERQGDSVTVELISVSYNSVAAAREAHDNGFPDWAQWIATGKVS